MKSIIATLCLLLFSQLASADVCSRDGRFAIEKRDGLLTLFKHNLFPTTPTPLSKQDETLYYNYAYNFLEFRPVSGSDDGILTVGDLNAHGEPIDDSLRDIVLKSKYCLK